MIGEQTKNKLIFLLVAFIVVMSIAFIFFKRSVSYTESIPTISTETSSESSAPRIIIGNTYIPVELALTNTQIQKGLSGRSHLPPSSGMLFIFSKPSFYNFWMPDMNFPLDMIWINDGKVVDISHNVSNNFDRVHPVFYRPKEPAQYVIEVNANFSIENNINIGDTVTFENILLKQ